MWPINGDRGEVEDGEMREIEMNKCCIYSSFYPSINRGVTPCVDTDQIFLTDGETLRFPELLSEEES
jgi:hypothetical protein